MKLDDLFDLTDLDAAIEAGHVSRKRHPELPLSIYTYTRAAQYEQAWTPVTMRCRGLIAHDFTGDIVAHCLPKFFNYGEHDQGRAYAPPLPDEPFRVYDKVDGSLGIVFHYGGKWRAASKGSFASEQALWAQAWLDDHNAAWLVPGFTYLAEIVYPENRIVCDYGQRRDLILLAVYDTEGREAQLAWAAPDWEPVGSVVRTWPFMLLPELLKAMEGGTHPDGQGVSGTEAEGFVLRYASGLRVKVKYAEYVRLHKILTGINERDIWRCLGAQLFAGRPVKELARALTCSPSEAASMAEGGRPLDALLEHVPDEFDQWARGVAARVRTEAAATSATIESAYALIKHHGADRGQFARAAQQIPDGAIRAAMFLRLDGRPIDLHVWRAIKPEASDPFKKEDDGDG